jgi:hypothetical protein
MKPATLAEAEDIALKALAFLGADEERLERFLALSGLDVATLRTAAREPGFLAGVLDHVATSESLLLAFAEEAGLDPMRIDHARARLAGPTEFEDP